MHVIQQALSDGEGVANISNGITVHGKTTEEHDESSKRVLEKFKKKKLRLNAEKCQTGVYGTDANKQGYIEPTEEKGKAVVKQRQESCRMPWKLEAS